MVGQAARCELDAALCSIDIDTGGGALQASGMKLGAWDGMGAWDGTADVFRPIGMRLPLLECSQHTALAWV